jgi:hypothetical protein
MIPINAYLISYINIYHDILPLFTHVQNMIIISDKSKSFFDRTKLIIFPKRDHSDKYIIYVT